MDLLTTIEDINAEIKSACRDIANHAASCAVRSNHVVELLLRQDDETLTQWLNSRSDVLELFGKHEAAGVSINTAEIMSSELAKTTPQQLVDVRPFAEKLAAQNRTVAFDGTVWSVTTIAPEPAPVEDPIEITP